MKNHNITSNSKLLSDKSKGDISYKSNICRRQPYSSRNKVFLTTCITKPRFGRTIGSLVNSVFNKTQVAKGIDLPIDCSSAYPEEANNTGGL